MLAVKKKVHYKKTNIQREEFEYDLQNSNGERFHVTVFREMTPLTVEQEV